MEAQFAGKKVPWSHLEEYLTIHKKAIGAYIDLENAGVSRDTIETLLPNSIWTIHQTITRIIKDNKLEPS